MNKRDAKTVINSVCDRLELQRKVLFSNSKKGRVSEVRAACAFVLKEISGETSREVAAHLKVHYTTVDKALARLKQERAEDATLDRRLDRVLKHARATLETARNRKGKEKQRKASA